MSEHEARIKGTVCSQHLTHGARKSFTPLLSFGFLQSFAAAVEDDEEDALLFCLASRTREVHHEEHSRPSER